MSELEESSMKIINEKSSIELVTVKKKKVKRTKKNQKNYQKMRTNGEWKSKIKRKTYISMAKEATCCI